MRFQECVEDRVFSPVLIADALRTLKSEAAGAPGLGRDAFSQASRVRAYKTRIRLHQVLKIPDCVEAETGSPLAAYAWFRAEPLPGCDGAVEAVRCARVRSGTIRTVCLPPRVCRETVAETERQDTAGWGASSRVCTTTAS